MVTEASSAAPLLSFQHVATRFGRKTVHKDISFDLYPGEIVTLLGGSGTGKSTLMRLLIGLETAAGGKCLYHGEDVFSLDERGLRDLRLHIAYAFQGGALFDSLTIEENLAFPLNEHSELDAAAIDERVHASLARFGLAESGKLLPASLSGGMQKRAGLARALMLDPELILYDEPTAGLDPANTRRVADLILELKAAGKTAILVTHDTELARAVSDRFVLIGDGVVLAEQTAAAFRDEPNPALKTFFEADHFASRSSS